MTTPFDPSTAPPEVPVTSAPVPAIDQNALLQGIAALCQALADRQDSRDQELASVLRLVKESKTDLDTPKPKAFTGRQKDSTSFLFQVNACISASPNKYDTDIKKIRFLASRLEDTALVWYMGLLQRNAQAYVTVKNAELAASNPQAPPLAVDTKFAYESAQYPFVLDCLLTWQGFLNFFHAHFCDPDARATAERRLASLRQTTSVSAYASEFQTYCYELNDTEQRMATNFYKNLKPVVKDEVHRLGKPDTLAAMIEAAIRADTRIMERAAERRQESSAYPSFAAIHHPPVNTFIPRVAPSASTGPVPMQVDALQTHHHSPGEARTRTGPLSAEERQRRIDLNLCLYCGMPHHRAANCPNRPAHSRKPPSAFTKASSALVNLAFPSSAAAFDPSAMPPVELPAPGAAATYTLTRCRKTTSRCSDDDRCRGDRACD